MELRVYGQGDVFTVRVTVKIQNLNECLSLHRTLKSNYYYYNCYYYYRITCATDLSGTKVSVLIYCY